MRSRAWAVAALLLAAFRPAPATSQEGAGTSIAVPAGVAARRAAIVDQALLDLAVDLGYAEARGPGGDLRLARLEGVTARRAFVKGDRTLEVGVTGSDETGWSIRLWGSERGGRGNPDLAWMGDAVRRAIRSARQGGAPSLGYLTYRLSYTQADRVLAVVKALGYSAIEFEEKKDPPVPGVMLPPDPLAGERDKMYQVVKAAGTAALPYVVRLADSEKTSLMEPGSGETGAAGSATDLGGTYLHQTTSSEQQQRLLVVYDRDFPEDAERLLNLLRREIDVPARQIVIEALVIEINEQSAKDLGVSFRAGKGKVSGGLFQPLYASDATGRPQLDSPVGESPFFLTLEKGAASLPFTFQAQLSALVQSGRAQVLSKPSVLVLDGRQARIQVGQQVPVSKAVAAGQAVATGIEYITVGIVLNLRPRVSDDGQEISMQVETIVSAVNQVQASSLSQGDNVLLAPTLDNRQVQSIVRVADSTPFIIGGLISTLSNRQDEGVPVLSDIPLLGRLFRRTRTDSDKKEVIVVLTPHVVPVEDRSFSYVIPKDSDIFNSFDKQLFRNAYRIESGDVYDLRFIRDSPALHALRAEVGAAVAQVPSLGGDPEVKAVLEGRIPGEEIMVRRMLWELVRKTGFARHVDLDKTIFFASEAGSPGALGLSFFGPRLAARTPDRNALVLTFAAEDEYSEEHPFPRTRATFAYESVAKDRVGARIREANRRAPDGKPLEWGIVLTDEPAGTTRPIDLLKGILVLKRILELNTTLPLTIDGFHAGRQVIFPSQDDLEQRFHVVDRDSARLFYEVWDNYAAFEAEYNQRTRALRERLRKATAGH